MRSETRALSGKPRLRLRLAAAAESMLRAGHPWVFAESIRSQNREGRSGELAVIYDRRDRFLAMGLFDPDSPIRVRILHRGAPVAIDDAWWSTRLEQPLKSRHGLFDERTNGYRWINGESDGWPGLVLDRYHTTLVLKLYTSAWLPRLADISEIIQQRLRPERIVLRLSRNVQCRRSREEKATHSQGRRVKGEGRVEVTDADSSFALHTSDFDQSLLASAATTVWRDGAILRGAPLEGPVIFLENGLRFEADVLRGQKTGFFLDQRDNRRIVESLAQGRRVLNAFSFSGGFSVHAARGGALSVTDLDMSPHALAAAKRNFALNESFSAMARCRRESVQADAFDWLETGGRSGFDLIILDPPSFAKREAERSAAIRAYEKLASLGIRHLARAGILVACSCSAHVSAEEFFQAVRRSAVRSKRRFDELRTTGHPPDHPASFKEAGYLKAIYLKTA
jgi:23S rRNA (cytosine1962-C5)-methyltransferase